MSFFPAAFVLILAPMYLNDLYRSYFKHQAVNHPDLLHDDASGSRIFAVIGIEEALGDFRSGVKEKDFILRLILPTTSITDNGDHEVRKYWEGGFIVARHFSSRQVGTDDFFAAMTDAERVNDEIIEKMLADSRNGHPLWYYSLDSRQDIRSQPRHYLGDASYAGWLTTFGFSNWWRNCITDPAAPVWADGGLTPY